MGIEGSVDVRVDWNGQQITTASVRSRRLQIAGRLLVGLAPDAAAARVPLVYSLCARAQGLAARLALDAAHGLESLPSPAQQIQVAAEAVHESMWRMLGDWPRWLADPPGTAALMAMRSALKPLLAGQEADCAAACREAGEQCRGILEQSVLGMPMMEWLEDCGGPSWRDHSPSVGARILRAAAALAGSTEAALLPESTAEGLARGLEQRLADGDFADRPDWLGTAVETGPVARLDRRFADWTPTGGQWRMLARIRDAADRIGQLLAGGTAVTASAARNGDGKGWAVVETARGLLTHVATVAGGLTVDYRIIAPTEWNFHPQGALPSMLSGIMAADRDSAERLAGLAVQALDPCVQYRVEVVDA